MLNRKLAETMVGIFVIAAFLALFVTALRATSMKHRSHADMYHLSADFDNIGGLRVRAPVRIAGVRIGEVSAIHLNKQTFKAVVQIAISDHRALPVDSEASIMTEGLLGAQYVSISPGFEIAMLQDGGMIEQTHPALVLEQLIGKLLFNYKKDS